MRNQPPSSSRRLRPDRVPEEAPEGAEVARAPRMGADAASVEDVRRVRAGDAALVAQAEPVAQRPLPPLVAPVRHPDRVVGVDPREDREHAAVAEPVVAVHVDDHVPSGRARSRGSRPRRSRRSSDGDGAASTTNRGSPATAARARSSVRSSETSSRTMHRKSRTVWRRMEREAAGDPRFRVADRDDDAEGGHAGSVLGRRILGARRGPSTCGRPTEVAARWGVGRAGE